MLSTKKGLCLLKIYQPKRNPTPHLPPKSPQNSTHKILLKLRNETFTATNKSNKSYMEITF